MLVKLTTGVIHQHFMLSFLKILFLFKKIQTIAWLQGSTMLLFTVRILDLDKLGSISTTHLRSAFTLVDPESVKRLMT
jgi:hypothetical protein